MIASILVLLLIVAGVIYFVLNCTVTTAVASVFCSLFGLIVALGYYENVAALLAAQGLVGPLWSAISLLALYALTTLVLRALAGFVVGSEIDFGNLAKKITLPVLGAVQGLMLAGIVMIGTGIYPPPLVAYSRFGDGSVNPNMPKTLMVNADGLVSGLFSWFSQGSLRSGKSFAVLHADYLDQLHLARIGGVYPQAGPDAIRIPSKGARIREFDGHSYLVVRLELRANSIKNGGAADPSNMIQFAPAQVRLLCKESTEKPDLRGRARVVYPVGFVSQAGTLAKKDLAEVLQATRAKPSGDTKPEDIVLQWPEKTANPKCDVVFDMPQGLRPILVQYKIGATAKVPAVQASTQELEDELEGRGQPASGNN